VSLRPASYEAALASHKPLKRSGIKRAAKGMAPRKASLKRTSRKGKPKQPKTSALKKKAWTQFSIFIRTRGADSEGFNVCVTCRIKKYWRDLQAGHFIQGRHNANLFDERGTNPQCYSCNVGRYGAAVLYYKWMLAHYGQEVIDELLEQNQQTRKWQAGELEALLAKYTALNEANPLIEP